MNLFIVGWNLPKARYPRVLAELHQMTTVYPLLDPETLWHSNSACGTIFTASMHTANRAAAPRRYVMQSDDQVTFYSGLPVQPTGAYPAHHAAALSAHWDQLTENLEGQYFIARAMDAPPRLELLTDILGMEQVFYLYEGGVWLISNSVQLIERITKPRALDPLGVSLFLTTAWVGADHTLRSDIRVIPAGQHWIWQEGDNEPRRQSYYPPSKLASQPHQALTLSYIRQLAEDLMQLCRNLSQNFGELECHLTGGRDSRLLAALMIRAGLPGRYCTYGDSPDADTEIATRIAQTFDLPFEVRHIPALDVIQNWDKVCRQIVRQNDGMKTLRLIQAFLKYDTAQVDHLGVTLWGVGGEIARAVWVHDPRFYLHRHDAASVERVLAVEIITDGGGLIRQEGVALARDYLHRFAVQCIDDGFAPVDIPDVFYAYQRTGRRGGNNTRASMGIGDLFSPYCSRPFVEAAFAIPAQQRYTQSLPYHLIRFLSPELHRLPFDKAPWPLQQPALNLLHFFGVSMWHKAGRHIPNMLRRLKPEKSSKKLPLHLSKSEQLGWFEPNREQVREMCLDQNTSSLWSFVDRSTFERLTASSTDPQERNRYIRTLYDTMTLFYYEADDRRHALPASSLKSAARRAAR